VEKNEQRQQKAGYAQQDLQNDMKNVHDGLSKKRKTGAGLVRDEVALEPDNVSKLSWVQTGATHKQAVNIVFCHDGGSVVSLDRASVQKARLFSYALVEELGKFDADGSTHFLCVFRACNFAGSDSPHGLIGDHKLSGLFRCEAFDTGAQLGQRVLHVCSCLTDFEAFTDAKDRCDSVAERGFDLCVQDVVGLVVDGAAFTVPHQDIGAAQLAEELAGDVTGIGAGVELGQILTAVNDVKFVALYERLHAAEISERREDGNLYTVVVMLGVREGPGELLKQGDALDMVHVHLPVACDEGLSDKVAVGRGSHMNSKNALINGTAGRTRGRPAGRIAV